MEKSDKNIQSKNNQAKTQTAVEFLQKFSVMPSSVTSHFLQR